MSDDVLDISQSQSGERCRQVTGRSCPPSAHSGRPSTPARPRPPPQGRRTRRTGMRRPRRSARRARCGRVHARGERSHPRPERRRRQGRHARPGDAVAAAMAPCVQKQHIQSEPAHHIGYRQHVAGLSAPPVDDQSGRARVIRPEPPAVHREPSTAPICTSTAPVGGDPVTSRRGGLPKARRMVRSATTAPTPRTAVAPSQISERSHVGCRCTGTALSTAVPVSGSIP